MPAAGKEEGDPVTVFHPGMTGLSNGGVNTKDVEQLGPEPFGGIDSADKLEIVDGKVLGMGVDLCCLFYCGMVFPEYEQGVGILFEAREQA